MTTTTDVLDLRPLADHDTTAVLGQALAALARRRGLRWRPDPAVRLHLLVSLRDEIRIHQLRATLAGHHHGYTPTELAALLDLPG